MNFYQIFSKTYRKAAQKMCLDCQDFIENGSKILDLGCGSGIVGMTFQEHFQAKVIGVDIKDSRVVPLPFKIINGKSLPFPEKSFDIVLINYVLHHSKEPASLLKEAKRVSEKIIIYEDLPEGFCSKLICKIHGISFDKIFKNPNQTSFKSEEEWEKIFRKVRLNTIFKKKIRTFPVKKELFILEASKIIS